MAGTRIPVQAVLELVRDDMPAETIIRDYYPDLKPEDVNRRGRKQSGRPRSY